MLANVALTDFDIAVSQAGFGYARFADDFVVCAETQSEILSALDLVRDLASGLHLQLSEEKTMMTTFDEGFAFLGREFSSSEPHCIQGGAGKRRPDEVLYVGREDARIRLAKGRLVIEGPEGLPLMSVPKNTVSRVVVSGTVGMSAGVRSWALSTGATVVFLSRRGSYLGHLEGRRSERDAQRLLAQMRMSDSEECRLPLARAVVAAKMRHQVNVLLRLARRSAGGVVRLARRSAGGVVRGAAQGIRALIDEVSRVSSVEELLGIEGAASAAYFEVVSTLLPVELGFSGRNRRPPRDVTNAALSYGYAILLSECTGALVAAGLEPSLGILHSSTGKRPSLALDLMEEFRPLLVDRTVFGLARSKRLRCEHGTPADHAQEGVWLNRSGKKALVDGYEATLQRSVKGALPGFAGSWRRHIHHEAQLLARAIVEPDYVWRGVAWR
ncbi:CRISPR-associated endonuclease Cas1 [Schaalia canis]|uniref:CRISPR-associated endonuclease Cas1 n=2 Tax=Schaalia canis TaxID=100469 RepID=A0A3P1SDF9_9ACTO|nr:CRISPR-associated endonuclease Cas1 [Schaalia canis]